MVSRPSVVTEQFWEAEIDREHYSLDELCICDIFVFFGTLHDQLPSWGVARHTEIGHITGSGL